jgi:hypothetical protein
MNGMEDPRDDFKVAERGKGVETKEERGLK